VSATARRTRSARLPRLSAGLACSSPAVLSDRACSSASASFPWPGSPSTAVARARRPQEVTVDDLAERNAGGGMHGAQKTAHEGTVVAPPRPAARVDNAAMWSGSSSASLRRRPLKTGHATFTASGLNHSKPGSHPRPVVQIEIRSCGPVHGTQGAGGRDWRSHPIRHRHGAPDGEDAIQCPW